MSHWDDYQDDYELGRWRESAAVPTVRRKKGKKVSKQDKLNGIRKAMAALAEEMETISAWPDEPSDGSVIKFLKRFNSRGTEYSYVAVRVNKSWYLSGTTNTRYTWEQLMEWLDDDRSTLEIATDWDVV